MMMVILLFSTHSMHYFGICMILTITMKVVINDDNQDNDTNHDDDKNYNNDNTDDADDAEAIFESIQFIREIFVEPT